MSTPTLEDLGERVVRIAQALAGGANPDPAALEQLLFGQVAQVQELVDKTAGQLRATAEALKARAEQRVTELEKAKDKAVADANAVATEAVKRATDERDRALAAADRARQAADTALEQARATADRAATEAERTHQAALDVADRAEQAAKDAFAQVEQAAKDQVKAAEDAAKALVEEAEQAVAAAEAQVAAAVGQAGALVGQAAAAAGDLPELVALGKDGLARLEGALSWPSGILSLVAQALVWLKNGYFADVDELQVVWQQAASPDGPGIGLVWREPGKTIRLVYRPPAGAGPGSLLVETTGADSVSFTSDGNPGISVAVTAKAEQALVVGQGVAPPAGGPDAATFVVTFTGGDFERTLGPLTAKLAKPVLTVDLRHAASWGYAVTLDAPTYGATLGLSELLAQAGIPLPISVPSIDELRSLTVSVADGVFSVKEGPKP